MTAAAHDASTRERQAEVISRLRAGERIVRGRVKNNYCWVWQPSGERAPGKTIQAMIGHRLLIQHGAMLVEG